MKHLFRLVLCLLALGASSCEKFNTRKVFLLDANFRSYFQFQNGSSWIYTLQSDTMIKEKVTLANFIAGRTIWDAFEQDFLQYDLVSDIDSTYKFRTIADENNTTNVSLLYKDTFFKRAAQWYYVSNTFTGISGTGDTLEFHPSFLESGKNYTNVIELKPSKSAFFKRLIMAQGVGIIRKELHSGKKYVLKSYNVQ